MADSRIKEISSLLEAFFDRETIEAGGRYVEFLGAWRHIAGSRLGDHSRPIDVRQGVLIVEAEHPGWIQLLQMKQEQIIEAVQAKYPELGVRAMALRVGRDRGVESGGSGVGGEAAAGLAAAGNARPETVAPAAATPAAEPEAGAGNARAETAAPAVATPAAEPEAGVAEVPAEMPEALKGIFNRLRENLRE